MASAEKLLLKVMVQVHVVPFAPPTEQMGTVDPTIQLKV
jgi:hypothetical protein